MSEEILNQTSHQEESAPLSNANKTAEENSVRKPPVFSKEEKESQSDNEVRFEDKYLKTAPKKHPILIATLILGILSSVLFFALNFFSFGKIGGEALPSLWDFLTNLMGMNDDLPTHAQYLVPLNTLAISITVALAFIITSISRLVIFLTSNGTLGTFRYYTSVSFFLPILVRALNIYALFFFNRIAVESFIIESSYMSLAFVFLGMEAIAYILHAAFVVYYYSSDVKAIRKINKSRKDKRYHRGSFLIMDTYAILVTVAMFTGIGLGLNLPMGTSSIPKDFPKNSCIDVYSCDFDEEPSFTTPSMEYVFEKENSLYFYTNNYHYYKSRISALEKEINEDLDIERIAEKTKILKNLRENFKKLEYGYVYINFSCIEKPYSNSTGGVIYGTYVTTFRINELTYNTKMGSDNVKKWGAEKELLNYFFDEKIELEKTTFEEGTDFSSEKVGVKIFYNDGSMKIYYVTPSNAAELNNAAPGTHTFKWSDSWGEYSAKITIIN